MSNLSYNQLLHDMHDFCVNPHTREIFLHSCVDAGSEEEIDYKMAVVFEKNMA